MPHEPSEHVPRPEIPQSWHLDDTGDGEDLVMALAGTFGGMPVSVEGRYVGWIPPEPPPAVLLELLDRLRVEGAPEICEAKIHEVRAVQFRDLTDDPLWRLPDCPPGMEYIGRWQCWAHAWRGVPKEPISPEFTTLTWPDADGNVIITYSPIRRIP